jgi:RinA family phage transcriptional activator
MNLRKSTFRYIEQEIYNYHETKKSLDGLTDDIIYSTPPYKEVRTNDPKDITYETVALLATNKIRKRMIDTIYVIEIVFNELDPTIRDALEDKYWNKSHLTWTDVASLHHVDRRTIYRWRTALVTEIATRLGLY